MHKIIKFFSSRLFWLALLLLLQIWLLLLAVWGVSSMFVHLRLIFRILSLCIVCWIINRKDNPSVKLPWVILILLFPLFGGIFYLMFGTGRISPALKKEIQRLRKRTIDALPEEDMALEALKNREAFAAVQASYLQNYCFMPVYQSTRTQYLPLGEIAFRRMLQILSKAEKFIFIEFFIISEGKMWNSMLSLLEKKAAQGIEVRVIFDDAGCMGTLPHGYQKKLQEKQIKCVVFNPFRPSLRVTLNNRDHRKLMLVDGITAITGGFNLSDEYINTVERHGHWKDSGVLLEGEAVWSFTLMFLETWNFFRPEDREYHRFRPSPLPISSVPEEGFVQPYHDSPLDQELVGESVYLHVITHAMRYLYITTPYLIVDNELTTALCLAAKSGVEVKIITPGIFDHWYVHWLTQSYYPQLIEAGVQIYEYTPGFIHAKTFVADDCIATVGSVNMDYRSLYHHFECGVWMYRSEAVAQVRDDFLRLLPVCNQVTEESCRAVPWYFRCIRSILRLFAPLI